MSADDAALFAVVFASEGASRLRWDQAARCSCWTDDTHQPQWDHLTCSGSGVVYTNAGVVRGLFRGQSRWTSPRASGEHGLGEAQITLPLTVKPTYVDHRVRDRFTVLDATGDTAQGRVFYPAADPVPFLYDGVQHAWRVQLQSHQQTTRVKPL